MIIDEWDAICRENNNEDVMRQYVDWLRGLFKTEPSDVVFAGVYMTGILPIKQYNTQSALNNFEEFSMINPGPLAGCFGFTKDEVHGLAEHYRMDEAEIKRWYDGYQIGNKTDIFNPYAVIRAVQRHSIESYWTSTGAYKSLLGYITMNYDGLRDAVIELLIGEAVKVDVVGFSNDMHMVNNRNSVLTLLIHLGYLSYDGATQTARIPNVEVRAEFERAIRDSNWTYLAQAIQNSDRLLQDTLAGREEAVERAIELVHQDNTSILQYHDENALAYVVSLAYVAACKDYTSIREMPSGKGFADIVFIPRRNVDKPAIVIELKYNHSAKSALEQIRRKEYTGALKDFVGEMVLVGISYNEKTKKHSCVIEKVKNIPSSYQVVTKSLLSRYQVEDAYSLNADQVIQLLEAVRNALTAKQMRELLGRKGATYFSRNTIRPMIADKIIAPVKVDAKTSSKQRYYLTENGAQLLTKLMKDD